MQLQDIQGISNITEAHIIITRSLNNNSSKVEYFFPVQNELTNTCSPRVHGATCCATCKFSTPLPILNPA